jgi:hypothetical protein
VSREYTLEEMKPRDELEERLARLMCEIDAVDPEQKSFGIGALVPRGEPYTLLEVRVPAARKIIEFMKNA